MKLSSVLAAASLAFAACTSSFAATSVAASLPSSSYSASSTWNGFDAEAVFNGGMWNAGTWGTQWVQVDLGSSVLVSGVSFVTNQVPDGQTWQQLYISNAPIGSQWSLLSPVASLSGFTTNVMPLSFTLAPTVGRYVTLVMNGGPSWTAAANITVTTSAVPEVQTSLLALAGVGVLGFALQRRRTATQA
jgi:hypothetical protein